MNEFFNNARYTVNCGDLRAILEDLSNEQLLGKIQLSSSGEIYGFVNLSPTLVASLIAYISTLTREDDFSSLELCFERSNVTLTVRGDILTKTQDMNKLRRLADMAGFDTIYARDALIFSAKVITSPTLEIYALELRRLKAIFDQYFKK